MAKTALQIAREVDALLDSKQEAKFKALAGIERLLFVKLVSELKVELSEENGRITSRKGSVALSKAIDAVFDAVTKQHLGAFAKTMAGDMSGVLSGNARYYKALRPPAKGSYDDITKSVDARMRKRMGITGDGDVQLGGFLSQAYRTQKAREEVNSLVNKAVAGGIPMRQLERELRVRITGTKKAAGVLEKHLTGFVLDAYQIADSVTNNGFADRLGLKYFIYSGGLIETSREFCRKRNQKVFTTEETKTWAEDPTLPRTKEEADSGVITDYAPLEDRGRWRCRHRLLYIPYEEAVRRRPDLVKPGDAPKKPAEGSQPKEAPQKQVDEAKSLPKVEDRIRTQKFESAALYDAKGQPVFFKDGEASSVTFTTEEISKMKGGTLTHNHPSGRSFSNADFYLAVTNGLGEIRAAHAGGVYRMKLPKSITFDDKTIRVGFGIGIDSDSSEYRAMQRILQRAYFEADTEVRGKFEDAIMDGRMTEAQANATHHHEIWKRLSERMGFKYTVE